MSNPSKRVYAGLGKLRPAGQTGPNFRINPARQSLLQNLVVPFYLGFLC